MYNNPIIKSATSYNNKIITCVADYLQAILSLEYNNNTILFRGQSDKDYKLVPSIGRKNPDGSYLYNIYDEEKIFLEFKKRYHSYTDNRPTTDADLLFLAQHHELPTRLLDWSYNPLIALYFACQSSDEKDGAVFTISIEGTNKDIKEGKYFMNHIFDKEKYPNDYVFLIPDDTHIRYIHQSGMFILFKNPQTPIDSLEPSFLIQEKSKILKEMKLLGITDSFVIPNLDNLCKEIKNNHQNK